MIEDVEDFLAHYGKLGMKWGRRSASAKSKTSEDYASVKKLKKTRARKLSNEELKKAINRMNLEKQYRDLNPKGISKGNKIALTILAVGTTVNSAIAFANSPAGQAVKTAVKDIINKRNN